MESTHPGPDFCQPVERQRCISIANALGGSTQVVNGGHGESVRQTGATSIVSDVR
jgi:hypothetical protein